MKRQRSIQRIRELGGWLCELGGWLCKAWPVVVWLLLAGIHLLALNTLVTHSVMVNKLTGTAMQVVGGLIVLHSVNGNLELFRNQSLSGVVVNWLREFPMARRSVTASISGVGLLEPVGRATVNKGRAANTVEERVAEVERRLDKLRVAVDAQDEALHRHIENASAKLLSSIEANRSEVNQIADRLESTAVGGFKQQAFGVMLAIYGAFISVFV